MEGGGLDWNGDQSQWNSLGRSGSKPTSPQFRASASQSGLPCLIVDKTFSWASIWWFINLMFYVTPYSSKTCIAFGSNISFHTFGLLIQFIVRIGRLLFWQMLNQMGCQKMETNGSRPPIQDMCLHFIQLLQIIWHSACTFTVQTLESC